MSSDVDLQLRLAGAVTSACIQCSALCATRTNVVIGRGTGVNRAMIVGEAPGAEEDASGRPFMGTAGQLLTGLFAEVGLELNDFYVTNTLKCRPPKNRDPEPEELASCRFHLARQVSIIQPRLVVAVGRFAAASFLGLEPAKFSITKARGHWVKTDAGTHVMPLLHPSYLARNRNDEALWAATRADIRQIVLAFAIDVYEDTPTPS